MASYITPEYSISAAHPSSQPATTRELCYVLGCMGNGPDLLNLYSHLLQTSQVSPDVNGSFDNQEAFELRKEIGTEGEDQNDPAVHVYLFTIIFCLV